LGRRGPSPTTACGAHYHHRRASAGGAPAPRRPAARTTTRSYLVERVDDGTFGQDLRQQGRCRDGPGPRRIQDVEGHTAPADGAEYLADGRVPIGPVGLERHHALPRERVGDGR